jgi:hypothetical protein
MYSRVSLKSSLHFHPHFSISSSFVKQILDSQDLKDNSTLGLLYSRSHGWKNLRPTLSTFGLLFGPQVSNKC